MHRTSLLLLFLFLTASASADFFIGDTAFRPDLPRAVSRIAVTSDGETFFIAARNGVNRVRTDGTILDAEPFGVRNLIDPLSAAYGRGLVVITHKLADSLNGRSHFATAMTTTGEILWTRFVANNPAVVVYDGAAFVIVYGDEPEVIAGVLDTEGFISARVTVARYSDGVRPTAPRAVRTDRGLLAVWRENGDLRAVPFDANGPRREPATIGTGPVTGFGSELNDSFAIAASGPDALVVWVNRTQDDPARMWIAARLVDPDGNPLGAETEIPLTRRPGDPDVIWDGVRYQAAWTSMSLDLQTIQLEVATISPGAQEGASIAVISPSRAVFAPALAVTSDSVVLLAWSDYVQGGVRGKMLTSDRTWEAAPERVVRTVPRDALGPAAVWTGQHYVTAWVRFDPWNGSEVVLRRFDRNGAPLDVEARSIGAVWDVDTIRAASSGMETALVWTDAGSVFVSRIAPDGTLLDPRPRLVATDAKPNSADVASSGNRFVITWAGEDSVNVRRLSARGGFVDTEPIEVAAVGASMTRVVFDGSMFRIGYVWPGRHEGTGLVFPGDRLEATSLSPTGASSPPSLLSESAATGELAMATSGSTHLFVSGRTVVVTDRELRVVHEIVDGPHIDHPNAVWTGTMFAAAGNGWIAWISPAGAIGPTFIPSPFTPAGRALAASGDGTALLLYNAPTPTFRISLYGRIIAPRRRAAGPPE